FSSVSRVTTNRRTSWKHLLEEQLSAWPWEWLPLRSSPVSWMCCDRSPKKSLKLASSSMSPPPMQSPERPTPSKHSWMKHVTKWRNHRRPSLAHRNERARIQTSLVTRLAVNARHGEDEHHVGSDRN